MGSSFWNDDFYRDRQEVRARTKTSAFVHDTAIKTGAAPRQVHAKMNPHGVKVRESRDSREHPESLAIAVMCDVTGSMQSVPRTIQKQLPKLMGLLTKTGIVKDPQILFGAVGDANSDRGSLQVGQFESGIEMDDDLGRMWLEGGGGGSMEESYQNAIYFFARHTSIDCFEKRGKKGYLFIIGDEKPYPSVTPREVQTLCGDGLQAEISTQQIVKEAQEKYHVFFVIPQHTSYGGSAVVRETWEQLLGADHVLQLTDEANICELISLTVGLTDGSTTLEKAQQSFKEQSCSDRAFTSVASAVRRTLKPTTSSEKTLRL